MNIVILEYGTGNLSSIKNMFKKAGYHAKISRDHREIESASHLVLPGVGAFDTGMRSLSEANLIDILNKKVIEEKTPILGICLGMQLLTKGSEEGDLPGLGWIDAYARKFRFEESEDHASLKVPHMGWNEVQPATGEPIFNGYDSIPKFYFVHSYHVHCNNPENRIGSTNHGISFTSAVRKENIIGAQFHPEKSHRFGLKLFSNFSKITSGECASV